MANTKLLEREIHNLADAAGGRRVTLTFGLVYQTPPAKLRQVEALAKAAVEAQPGCKLVRCLVTALGPSALDHELVWDDKAIDPDSTRPPPRRHRPRADRGIRDTKESPSPTRPRPPSPPPRRDAGHAVGAAGRIETKQDVASPRRGLFRPHCGPRRAAMPVASLEAIRAQIGSEVGMSDWILVDQARIDAFADATEDRQFIHVDPAAAAQTPFGGTIAHGFLSLSLLSRMAADVMQIPDTTKMAVNYGLDRVRFIAPVRAGKPGPRPLHPRHQSRTRRPDNCCCATMSPSKSRMSPSPR